MSDDRCMRTTLDLDKDVLQAARELAKARGITTGKVLSELARKGLQTHDPARTRNGVRLLPPGPVGASRPTMKLVNDLRDQD